MSCVSCDGAGFVDPPNQGWILTGEEAMPCPVCRGPHLKWLVNKVDDDDQVIVCSVEECDKEIRTGWLIYAQLTTSELPKLDEAILLCCDEHAKQEEEILKQEGHPTVCLPFCINDAREIV